MRLRHLCDWNDFFEREVVNVPALAKGTAVAVSLAGLAGGGAVAVAPALATRLGAMGLLGAAAKGASIQSLSGAALTNASLAYLGGGALAAGGGGMALGTGVIGVAGAVLGAARGAQIANAYFGDVNGYEIEQVRSGDRRRGPLVFVNGFLQQKDGQFDDWERSTRKVFPGSSAYGVKWESGRLAKLGRDLAQVVAAAALPHGTGRTKKVPGHPALAAVVGVAKLLDNPWHVAWRKAAQVGVLNADMLARFRGPQCTLMGHSLGARAIYFTLLQLAEKGKLAVNGEEVVAVEVKTTLRPENVKYFRDKLARFKEWWPEYQDRRVYGAMAYLQAGKEVATHAERQGFFVIRATGSSSSILNAEDFKPRVFA